MDAVLNAFSQIVTSFLTRVSDPLVLVCIIFAGYLAWDRYKTQQEFKAYRSETADSLKHLNDALLERHSEEKKQLLEIIDRYHEAADANRDALNEIHIVLKTMASR